MEGVGEATQGRVKPVNGALKSKLSLKATGPNSTGHLRTGETELEVYPWVSNPQHFWILPIYRFSQLLWRRERMENQRDGNQG